MGAAAVVLVESSKTDLGFIKFVQRKRNRLTICQNVLTGYRKGGDAFLERIVTGDDMWVRRYAPESKRQSVEWKHTDIACRKRVQNSSIGGKRD
jgi:hypothetical protein